MFLSRASSIIPLVGVEILNTNHSSPDFVEERKKKFCPELWMKVRKMGIKRGTIQVRKYLNLIL